MISRPAAYLVEGNPEITNLYPLFSGGSYPEETGIRQLAFVLRTCEYDLVVNTCPLIERCRLEQRTAGLIDHTYLTRKVVEGSSRRERLNKLAKTCRTVPCFERLDLDLVLRVAGGLIASMACLASMRDTRREKGRTG